MHQANLFNLLNASSYELPFFKAHQKTIHNCRSSGHKNGCSSRVDKNPLMMHFCCNFPRIKIVPVMTRKSKWLTSSFLFFCITESYSYISMCCFFVVYMHLNNQSAPFFLIKQLFHSMTSAINFVKRWLRIDLQLNTTIHTIELWMEKKIMCQDRAFFMHLKYLNIINGQYQSTL